MVSVVALGVLLAFVVLTSVVLSGGAVVIAAGTRSAAVRARKLRCRHPAFIGWSSSEKSNPEASGWLGGNLSRIGHVKKIVFPSVGDQPRFGFFSIRQLRVAHRCGRKRDQTLNCFSAWCSRPFGKADRPWSPRQANTHDCSSRRRVSWRDSESYRVFSGITHPTPPSVGQLPQNVAVPNDCGPLIDAMMRENARW